MPEARHERALGIPGDNTYSNLAEAQRTFWRTTVLPLVDRVASELSHWLAPGFARNAGRTHAPDAEWASEGANVRLVPDLDTLPALAGERDLLSRRKAGGLAGVPPDGFGSVTRSRRRRDR